MSVCDKFVDALFKTQIIIFPMLKTPKYFENVLTTKAGTKKIPDMVK